MKYIYATLTACMACGIVLHTAHAQNVGESQLDSCVVKMYGEMSKEQRTYRAHLYGEETASGSNIGKVLFDGSGEPWIKVEHTGQQWMSVSGDEDDSMTNAQAASTFGLSDEAASRAPNGTTRADENGNLWIKVGAQWLSPKKTQTDEEMEESRERKPMRGIFTTRRMLTSELIPYLTQSLRAFQCNTYSICQQIERSLGENTESLTIQVAGCEQKEMPIVDACAFAKNESDQVQSAGSIHTSCQSIAAAMVQQEASLLRLATEYDAAYRSMLQIAGNIDLSLREFKWPLINTVRQAVGVIGQLGRVPCFLSVCDESPIDDNLQPW